MDPAEHVDRDHDYQDLEGRGLVIEDGVEGLAVKKEVFAQLIAVCKAGAFSRPKLVLNIDEWRGHAPAAGCGGQHFSTRPNVMGCSRNVRAAGHSHEVLATVISRQADRQGLHNGGRLGRLRRQTGCSQALPRRVIHDGRGAPSPWQIDKVMFRVRLSMGRPGGRPRGMDVDWRHQGAFRTLTEREKSSAKSGIRSRAAAVWQKTAPAI